MTAPLSPPDDLHEPPPSPRRVLTVGLVGVAIVGVALVVGLATGAPLRGVDGHTADGPRALLAIAGLIVAGAAVSLRPQWFAGWLCYAAAGLLGYGAGAQPPAGTDWFLVPPRAWVAAVPNSWDSVQLFFGVVGGVAGLVGAGLTVLPRKVVLGGVLGAVAFHFAGILSAITSPPPSSWLSDQYWKRVSRPYLAFVYLNNAYQFYSPEPGPATLLWICIEYQTPDGAAPDCEWVYVPRRPGDVRDPLGLSYYRRLSLTENVTHTQPAGYQFLQAEWDQVVRRRMTVAERLPKERLPDNLQYQSPVQLVSLQILPSYARFFSRGLADPAKEVKGIKVYRAGHALIELDQLRTQRMSPYLDTLYQPTFLGEFDKDGRLKSTTDPVLYWRLPIVQHLPYPDSREEYLRKGGYDHYFTDYVSIHAGCPRPRE